MYFSKSKITSARKRKQDDLASKWSYALSNKNCKEFYQVFLVR